VTHGDWANPALPFAAQGVNGRGSGFAAAPTGAGFGEYPTTLTIAFTKRDEESTVLVRAAATFFTDNVNTGVEFGVGMFGFDISVSILGAAGTANSRKQSFGEVEVGGLPAGSTTVVMRWRRWDGTGSVFAGSNDFVCMFVEELGA